MADKLPRLRSNLDFMPSPMRDRPGLLIRDSYQYSDATVIVPPLLVDCLRFFDGEGTSLDLRSRLVELTGDLRVGELQQHLVESLSQAGFLEDEVYARLRREKHEAFAAAPVLAASHAGSAYPDEPEALRETLAGYLSDGVPPAAGAAADGSEPGLIGIAAPHVSPHGGCETYRAAYREMGPALAGRTFVVLGTSHYGDPDRFGLTRKPFATPYGQAEIDVELINRLEAEGGAAVNMEDYCHSVEHSIEFQVVFLQHLYGPRVRILPILCGSFARSIYEGGRPEDNDNVRRFFGSLGEMAARESRRLFWVLGIDMAHMGRRYGDSFPAQAGRGVMASVAERDQARIERINEGDSESFWERVQENQDDLKWCGSAPLYTFLKAAPQARGRLRKYEQWNIDEQSVVSFAAIAFRA
jgi:hypothetical protein